MKLFRIIISRMTMKKIKFAFMDKFSDKPVYYYSDKYLDVYLALDDFTFFNHRIKVDV